jgi:hypothetical protein
MNAVFWTKCISCGFGSEFLYIIYVNFKSLNSQSANNNYTKLFALLVTLVNSVSWLQINSVENLKYPEFKSSHKMAGV